MQKTRVYIVYTGGTIGMAPVEKDNPASPLEPKSLEELKYYMPSLKSLEREVEFGEITLFDPPLDSSDVKPTDWMTMARAIENVYSEYDGFIILHGTDTMAYTSSGLSFIFENLSKPVVITGSQLPISDIRTDAITNFTNAICIAGYKAFNLPKIPEVVIAFADRILRGNRATKVSSKNSVAFDSPNFHPLGKMGEHIEINTELLLEPEDSDKLILNTNFADERVLNIMLFPGFKPKHLRKLIEDEDVDAIIINSFGAGNAPGDREFLEVIENAIERKKIILNITQCLNGMVEMGRYVSSSALLERKVVSGLDMTSEAAMAKMMWTLGSQYGDGIITQLQINQRGEQSENLFDLRFGGVEQSNPKNNFTNKVTPDNRLRRDDISKAVVRVSGISVCGVGIGESAKLLVFMNKPKAQNDTPETDDRCVATFRFHWNDRPVSLIEEITERSKPILGQGDVILSVVSPNPNITFYFEGLYLALFSNPKK